MPAPREEPREPPLPALNPPEPPEPLKDPREAGAADAPLRFQSTSVSGISSRNREAGLYEGCPQALRSTDLVR